MTYEETLQAVHRLPLAEQDKLLGVLSCEHVGRKAETLAAGSTGWRARAWQAIKLLARIGVAAAALLGGGTAVCSMQSCAYNHSESTAGDLVKQSSTSFRLSPSELLAPLFGSVQPEPEPKTDNN